MSILQISRRSIHDNLTINVAFKVLNLMLAAPFDHKPDRILFL